METLTVLVAPAFARYACERSLVCCRAPMIVPIDPGEPEAVRAALARAGGDVALADELEARLEPHRDFKILAHPAGRCVMLADAPACRLHAAGGLAALPDGCRVFPRSIATRPDGQVEVAFTLRCTTAARLLAERPTAPGAPFTLAATEAPAWPYGRGRVVGETFSVCGARRALADVDALRRDWWAILAEATTGEAVVDALGAMLAAPDRPARAPREASTELGRPLGGNDLLLLDEALRGVPERGALYERFGWTMHAAARARWTLGRLTSEADTAPSRVAAAAASWLQWAGVHDERPFEAAIAMAVRRSLGALRLARTFAGVARTADEAALWRDAYLVSALLDVVWQ
ncbi:MAG: hypothetical protein KC635_25365 [Myxococcales bacterium]|nr:hypothetical protein [Myxococcales bacterium]MCB9737532.1 hypothetical protein [Deltaproteobacteria bacterium]